VNRELHLAAGRCRAFGDKLRLDPASARRGGKQDQQ
jgi:hypothetical protein